MSDASPALDEAFDRMASSGFELPNGFVNHGPMACEALAALDCDDVIDGWARRVARSPGTAVDARAPVDFDWRGALGDYRRLPEWIGHFDRAIADDGWPSVVEVWVPRLMPALAVALFHGATGRQPRPSPLTWRRVRRSAGPGGCRQPRSSSGQARRGLPPGLRRHR
jgi:hypothetical protein